MINCNEISDIWYYLVAYDAKLWGQLTHWGQDRMAAIFQTFSNALLWMKKIWILIKISLKFVLKGPINNIQALVQIMAWHQPGNKPLSEAVMTQFTDA